jgi:threonine/homoserine/homoserine lactone efflux protein
LDFILVLKGIIVGISVSAPLGPLGILCIQRTINKGFFAGFVSGLGAAVADILYASVAGFGISIIADFLKEHELFIRALGGIIVLVVGFLIFNSNPVKQIRHQKTQKRTYVSDFFSSIVITITNPLTIVFFGAVFAGFGLDESTTLNPILLTLAGIFSGALLWWMSLTIVVNIFRHKIRLRNLYWINKITGIIVAVFGVAVFVSIFFPSIQL